MGTDGMGNSLDKIRRLALVSGVLLLTYVVAGIAPAVGKDIAPLGLPFHLERPELVPFGLVLVCVYSALRFWLYGIARSDSPLRTRLQMWDGLQISWEPEMKHYLGTKDFDKESQADREAERLNSLYPRAFGKSSSFYVMAEQKPITVPILGWEDGDDEQGQQIREMIDCYNVIGDVPWIVRLGAGLSDIDYFAPIWLNVLALLLWAGSWVVPWVVATLS